jgi:PAS domain S-box-containing protein
MEEVLRLTQFSVEHSVDAAFWMKDDARFIYVNEAACNSLGYSKEDLLGMTVHDIDVDFPKAMWKPQWKYLKMRKYFHVKSRLRRKDGSVFLATIHMNYIVFENREYNCAFARDISKQQKEREQLQEKENQYQRLLEIAFKARVIHQNRCVVSANKEAMNLLQVKKEKEIIGLNINEFISPGYLKKAERRLDQLDKGLNMTTPMKLEILLREGSLFVELMSIPILYKDTPAVETVFREIPEPG